MYQGSDPSITLWSLQSIMFFCSMTGYSHYSDGEVTFRGITQLWDDKLLETLTKFSRN